MNSNERIFAQIMIVQIKLINWLCKLIIWNIFMNYY